MNAQMYNYRVWIKYIEDRKIKKYINEILDESGFNILDVCEHHFSPQGYTGLWLLSESHLAVHTFPEESKIYIELSSCVGEPFSYFINLIENHSMIDLIY